MITTNRTPFQRTLTGNPIIREWRPGSHWDDDKQESVLVAGGSVQIITNKARTFKHITLASTKRLIKIMERSGVDMQGGVIELRTRYATEVPAPDVQP